MFFRSLLYWGLSLFDTKSKKSHTKPIYKSINFDLILQLALEV